MLGYIIIIMPTMFDYRPFFCETDIEGHTYWGNEAAGCIFIAKDTGKILLAHRSSKANEPNTWGTWGGKIDGAETPKDAIERELEEETGFYGSYKITPLYVYNDGNFKYYNYLVVIPFQFSPELNWENDNAKWVEFGDWPEPMHFGLKALLQHDGRKIKNIIDIINKKRNKKTINEVNINNIDAFVHWFGKSVVKNKEGMPLIVYHGTNQPITSFSKSRRGISTQSCSSKKAYFFTDSPEIAEQYAIKAGTIIRSNLASYEKKVKLLQKNIEQLEKIAQKTGNWNPYEKAIQDYEDFDLSTMREDNITGQNIVPVYLKIENPFVYDFKNMLPKPGEIDKTIDFAIKNNNDGIILKNIIDPSPSSNHYVVFKSSQIKSAIGNCGQFNPKKLDITKEAIDMPPAMVQHANIPKTNSVSVLNPQQITNGFVVVATLWGEARGEGEQGMQAVLNVIMNRAKGDFNKAGAIALRKKQFSMWNGITNPGESAINLAREKKDDKTYQIALKLVNDAMHGKLQDITGGATFYFNPHKANPIWAKKFIKTKSIGNHNFYKIPKLPPKKAISENTNSIKISKLGMIGDGIFEYEMESLHSIISYRYEPDTKTFYLDTIETSNQEDQHKGYATALLESFFNLVHQYGGVLDVGSYTDSGMNFIRPVIERLSIKYRVRLI